jgi:hypothetical protein
MKYALQKLSLLLMPLSTFWTKLNILDQAIVTGSCVPANMSIAHHVTSTTDVPLTQFFD